MSRIQTHLRQTFLAGIFAVIPVFITLFALFWIDAQCRVITQKLFGKPIPVVGILIAIAAIYFCGLIASSLFGRFVIKIIDSLLSKIPGLRELYVAWKQIALTPGGSEGTYAKVVMIPDEAGCTHLLGFCSGLPIEGDENTFCVFVPGAPNPINGRLYFVTRDKCIFVNATNEEAFKVVLSTGNYVPEAVGLATKSLSARR